MAEVTFENTFVIDGVHYKNNSETQQLVILNPYLKSNNQALLNQVLDSSYSKTKGGRKFHGLTDWRI